MEARGACAGETELSSESRCSRRPVSLSIRQSASFPFRGVAEPEAVQASLLDTSLVRKGVKEAMPTSTSEQQRVVSCNISDLHPWRQNARKHSKAQLKQIAASIEAFGFTNPVLIDRQQTILAGHGRVAAAQLLGWTQVPCL